MKAVFAGSLLLLAANAFGAVNIVLSYESWWMPGRLDPGQEATWTYRYHSSAVVDARLILPLPPGARLLRWSDERWNCVQGADAVTCTRRLDPDESYYDRVISVTFAAPDDPAGLVFEGKVRIESNEPDPSPDDNQATFVMVVYRTFDVTTPDDFGAGSLRGAIERANAACNAAVPCKIRFAEAMRIAPSSPLPHITACDLFVDAGGYQPLARNRSFDTPRRVELSGENAGAGSGFVVAGACRRGVALAGMAIHSFPENGVTVAPSAAGEFSIGSCSIGTDAAGETAKPNLRGVSVDAPNASVSIGSSLIAGNARSGIAYWNSSGGYLTGNLIGVRFGGAPLPNGASGVFINSGFVRSYGNAIEYNRDFGIAVGPNARNFASQQDYIVFNGGIAIDWGLDGAGETTGRMPPVPQLLSATFDGTDTVIRGFLPAAKQSGFYAVRAYVASAGDHQGGISSGGTTWYVADSEFEVRLRGDHRGQTVTAASEWVPLLDLGVQPVNTSEYSAGIVVE